MYSDFLDRFTKSGAPVKDLSRFASLMHRLGDPQDSLRFIHVAGTNGKGSAVRMLTEIFTRAGYKTGEFTSPFIYRYNDRIKINGREIPDKDIERLIEKIKPALTDEGYSQFEITNAVAFLWYAEQKCDAVILEAGMGGLLDSTNIIKDNICSV
ncbi:MAG: bifunctional folylpolyglutamate synthase/dihydrofolate synthase, partial [Oscillospiraceae bacterium]|nr:bifunctional folylpolyglutamate synthase/dihydrofolate synthase [Oscillospiraceae bacterium]